MQNQGERYAEVTLKSLLWKNWENEKGDQSNTYSPSFKHSIFQGNCEKAEAHASDLRSPVKNAALEEFPDVIISLRNSIL